MIQVYSDLLYFRGSHYDFGRFQAEQLKESPILPNRKKQWEHKWERHFRVSLPEVKAAIKKISPFIWEELEGLKDGLEMSLEEAIREFGGYYLEYGKSGCSILTAENFLIRNYDNEPASYEGRIVLFQPDDGGYATIGPTMQITGRTDGMNEKGLVIGYNFVNRKNSDSGFVCNMIARLVLETCATVDEAIDLLKEIPHRHSFNYVLLDRSGASVIVEATPKKIAIRPGNICTNHFALLEEENRYRIDESLSRAETIRSQTEGIQSVYDAFRLLNDTDKGVFSKKYGAWAGTLHTAAYLPQELKAWYSLGGDRKPVIIDFQKWLEGENIYIKRIKGELEAKTTFVNMAYL